MSEYLITLYCIAFPLVKRIMKTRSTGLYEAMCKKEKVHPQSAIKKQLAEKAIQARYRQLGPKDVKPLAVALTVSYCF